MHGPYVVVEQFHDGADALRAAFEAHFRDPHRHSRQHQVWNYWYVPDSYTYLRTDPGRIIPEPILAQFMRRLNSWAVATLGLSTPLSPWLSLYVDGCGQTIHNDSLNGQMGYVYSLTPWDGRTFLGGETLLFRPENYWETERVKTSGAGTSFYDKVPSRFNQLLVFDDRVIHGVQPVQGTMDPLAGRVVLHGHLEAKAWAVAGPLPEDVARAALAGAAEELRALADEHAPLMHGFQTLRLTVRPDGRVSAVRCLCDRLLPLSPDKGRLDPYRQQVVHLLAATRFPAADAPSEVTLPVLVGG